MLTRMNDADTNPKRGKPTTVRFHPFDELMLAELIAATGLTHTEIVARAVRHLFARFSSGEVDIAKLPPVDPKRSSGKNATAKK